MAEWLWRVTQAKAFGRYKLSWILIGLSCVGSNPTLFIIVLLFITTAAEIRSFSFFVFFFVLFLVVVRGRCFLHL